MPRLRLQHLMVSACKLLSALPAVLLLCSGGATSAAVVRSLQDTWLVYDPSSANFLPYEYQTHQQSQAVSTWLYPRKDNYGLQLTVPPGTGVYVQNKLWYMVRDSATVVLKLSEIFGQEGNADNPLLLTLYAAHPPLDLSLIAIVNGPTTMPGKQLLVNEVVPLPLPKQPLRDELALVLVLLLLAYLSLRWAGGREFAGIFSMAEIVSNPLEGYGAASKRVFSPINVGLMVVNSATISYVFCLSDKYTQALTWLQAWLGVDELGAISWLLPLALGVGGLFYILAKYMLMAMTGALFQGSRLSTAHYLEFIRFSTWLALLLMMGTVLVFNSYLLSLDQLWQLATMLMLLVVVARVLKVLQAARQMPDFRLLYLIAYLCTTEIVPMVLLLRAMLPQEVVT